MTRILLVRHGESEWNADGRWQGQADPPLTDLGRQQAAAAARSIGAVDAIAASDLERARITAEIIAEHLGVGPVSVDPGLRERDAGEWSGLTRAQIHRDWPGYLPDDPVRPSSGADAPSRPPSWEPDEQLLARALTGLHRLAEQVGDGDAVAVTHGGVIYAIEAHLGEPWLRLANLGARWLSIDGGRLELGPRLVLVDAHEVTVTTPGQI
jgi:probable phosphoglycerate mutase